MFAEYSSPTVCVQTEGCFSRFLDLSSQNPGWGPEEKETETPIPLVWSSVVVGPNQAAFILDTSQNLIPCILSPVQDDRVPKLACYAGHAKIPAQLPGRFLRPLPKDTALSPNRASPGLMKIQFWVLGCVPRCLEDKCTVSSDPYPSSYGVVEHVARPGPQSIGLKRGASFSPLTEHVAQCLTQGSLAGTWEHLQTLSSVPMR